ncbi:TIGR01777 family protein [Pedobacter sp. BS3]|uniref:TIGR01777 family oxidoreductase n=1 Tax=Pedobacter sp. BS3 TaxID=2567937 RepID=UPI0011EC9B78|nr:TIGR01777 family oxidoreductase [Pedobacter sp. BS3]TZF82199.1 TIGR01777 family protein [Pedobacter sp. BS3]
MEGKIIIAGGTGALGQCLTAYLSTYELVILSRKPPDARGNVRYIYWDGITTGDWVNELVNATAIINLTGKSVNCRYTKANKNAIITSRVNSTLAIGKAISELQNPPKVWINAGSAAIYGNRGDTLLDEQASFGDDFSAEVCKQWEKAFHTYSNPETRKVLLRIGLVLQKDKGILKPFLNLAKFGFGGKIGSGRQYITWIHETDFAALVSWIINDGSINGVINAASPQPVENKIFMKSIRQAINFPFGIPNPAIFTILGGWLIGTEPVLILSGRRVISTVLKQAGYTFAFPYLDKALNNLLKQ